MKKIEDNNTRTCNDVEVLDNGNDYDEMYDQDQEYEYVFNDIVEDDDSKVDIKGWLAFFLYVKMGIGTAVSVAAMIRMFKMSIFTSEFKGGLFLTTAGMAFLAGLTIYGFHRGRRDAVPSAIAVLLVDLITMVALWAVIPSGHGTTSFSPSNLIFSLIGFAIWLWYLMASTRVEDICPRSEREITPVVVVPFVAAMAGIALMAYEMHSLVDTLM